jgi:hypothetical protein
MYNQKPQRQMMSAERSPGCERNKGPIEPLNHKIIICVFLKTI